jgi:nicotinamide-nucleotide amidase
MKKGPNSPACEIVTIGSELLLGQIVDTNTTYLAQELGKIGVTIRFRTAVGDRLDEIVPILGDALDRCDMVITTGGLGPTVDDLTREAVARFAELPLEFRQDLMEQIEEFFRRIGYTMSENNRRQAFVPSGSLAISNPIGTAPGFITEVDGGVIICLPGVQRELKYLLGRSVIPWIQQRYHLAEHRITYRTMKAVGIGESAVDRLIHDVMGEGKNPEVGLLASPGEIRIRITATAKNESEAHALIQPVEEEIRARLGNKIFGVEDDTLEGVVDSLLMKKGFTLAVLENFSGGLLAFRLHRLPCTRLVESIVISDKKQLIRWLNHGHDSVDAHAIYTLASRVKQEAPADLGLAVVGFPEKKGESYEVKGSAVALGEGIEQTFSWQFGGDLRTLQERAAVIGLNTLRLALLNTT